MERVTTLTVPVSVKKRLDELKISNRQAYYEVINALVDFFEKHAENKLELWKNDEEVKD